MPSGLDYRRVKVGTYAFATCCGCQESEPTLRANASIPLADARAISFAQLATVYGYVLPTIWWATTYFGVPARLMGIAVAKVRTKVKRVKAMDSIFLLFKQERVWGKRG